MVRLDEANQIFRCQMLDMLRQIAVPLQAPIALRYEASFSVVMDDGGQSLIVFKVSRRKR
jgi:hypothetical protein